MVRDHLTEMIFKQRYDRWGNSMSKGPEVEVLLSCVRNREEARVARAERELGRMVKVRQRGQLHPVGLVGLCLRGAGKDHHSISVHQAMGTLVPQTMCGAVQGLASSWRKS